VFEYGGFTLEAFFDEGVDFGVALEGFELFEDALATGGHLVVAYEEGFAEATVTEFSEDFVAVVEVVGCLHGGWFLVRMDYGVWVWVVGGYYNRGLGLSGKGGGIFLGAMCLGFPGWGVRDRSGGDASRSARRLGCRLCRYLG
jgi:hypothetical protein